MSHSKRNDLLTALIMCAVFVACTMVWTTHEPAPEPEPTLSPSTIRDLHHDIVAVARTGDHRPGAKDGTLEIVVDVGMPLYPQEVVAALGGDAREIAMRLKTFDPIPDYRYVRFIAEGPKDLAFSLSQSKARVLSVTFLAEDLSSASYDDAFGIPELLDRADRVEFLLPVGRDNVLAYCLDGRTRAAEAFCERSVGRGPL